MSATGSNSDNGKMNENRFVGLLCCKFRETKQPEARRVVKMIKDGNDLENMSQDTFLSKAKFIIENKIHKLVCPMCLKIFIKAKNRDQHVRTVHNKIKDEDLSCTMCDKSFMSKQSLKYHFDVSHGSSSAVKCRICDEKLGHAVSLERHMKLHAESIKLHQCKKCLKQFTRKDNLTVHEKVVHMAVNMEIRMVEMSRQDKESFVCKVCGVRFSGEGADKKLVAHLVDKCRAEERFPCNKCDKDFSSKFNMKQHERSFHMIKNILSCKFCDFQSQHKTSMTRHKKRRHGEE